MRVLYITDGGPGGVSSHVRCLTQCLKGIADVKVCITYRSDVLKKSLSEDGTPYEWCRCRNGHDLRLLWRVRKIIRAYRPDVIHFHDLPLFVLLYIKLAKALGFFKRVLFFSTIHIPSAERPPLCRRIVNWAAEPCYWLPVSDDNWRKFKRSRPKAKGEVFYNPIRLSSLKQGEGTKCFEGVIGMVGRNADQKDWPSFCRVVHELGDENGLKFWGVGVTKEESAALGQGAERVEWKGLQADGRDWISKMSLFVLTSKHEEMPTTVLESFLTRTPICGFVPEGGMNDILSLSNGALRKVFVRDRDCKKLADIVRRLVSDEALRAEVVADGWQIVTQHFDAEKNVRGRLMELYGMQNA